MTTYDGNNDDDGYPMPEVLRGLGRYLNQRQVAQKTGLTYGTIRNLRSAGKLPKPDLIWDKRSYWLESTINIWDMGRGMGQESPERGGTDERT